MKRRIINISFYVLVIAFMLVSIFLFLRKNNAFQIRAVKIRNNHFVSNAEIIRLAHINYSKDIFNVNLNRVGENILRHSMIKQVSVSRIFPSALKINIDEHQVIAGIAGSEVVAVSNQSYVIHEYEPEVVYDLPIITGIHFSKDSLGYRQPSDLNTLNRITLMLRILKKKDPVIFHDITEVNYQQGQGIVMTLGNKNVPIIMGSLNKENIVQKLNYLSTIYYHLLAAQSSNHILSIDLRFNGQVVVKEKT